MQLHLIILEKTQHPIFVTIGNIPTYLRNKPEAKALVVYIIIIIILKTKI
jgi:hypothetical protein